MNTFHSATFETDRTIACPLARPMPESKQRYGYIQPYRFYKSGKRVLVYKLPGEGNRLAVLKPAVIILAILAVAFLIGYVNGGQVQRQREGGTLPTAVTPNITFHRLITISAVHGAINSPIDNISRKPVQAEHSYQRDLLPRIYPSVREIS